MEQRATFSATSVCDGINSGAHGIMFQIRAKTELQVEALWVAAGWAGKYMVEAYCTEPYGDIPWQPPPFPPPTKPLAELDEYDVVGLLDSIRLEMYKTKFRSQKVTGSELVHCATGEKLHQHDSLKSLGMLFAGHRETLLAHIRNFQSSGGVPLTFFDTAGALAACADGTVKTGQWKHAGYTTLTEPKRMVKVMLSHKIKVLPGFTQAFYIHSKDGYGSAIGFRQGRNFPFSSGEDSHVQILGAYTTRDEAPFKDLQSFHCAFAGRVDYSIPESAPRAV